ncbi:MAG: DUF2156 domain-containing protein [Firmicutes bacterium]|nr:DUF2156 domain-containing protein [Bacillota bacterium]
MIFENNFDNLAENEIELLQSFFHGCDYQSSSHTFIASYMWRDTHHLSWQVIGDYLCMAGRGDLEGEQVYFMSFPLSRTGSYDVEKLRITISKAKEMFEAHGKPLQMSLIPGQLVPLLFEAYSEDEFELERCRDDDDYIYLKEDLATLSGRRYHQKKNHLNYFLRNYNYIYEEASAEMAEEIMAYIEYKNEYKLGETPEEWKEILELENRAVKEMLKFLGKGIVGGVIKIDGEIVAVTLGEFARPDKETILVHVEKADDRI